MMAPMLFTRSLALGAFVALLGSGPPACDKLTSLVKGQPAAPESAATTTVSSAPPPVLSLEEQAIVEAKAACLQRNDCQTAHERLVITIPEGSPIRARADYKDLENRWASTTVNDALNDPDVLGRRKLLQEVLANPTVDAQYKERAKNALNLLPTTAPTGLPPGQPPPDDLANAKKLPPKLARDLLLPKVNAGKATQAERDYLAGICKKLNDKACKEVLAKK